MKILVIDDNEGVRKLIEAALVDAGFDTVAAANALEALELVVPCRSEISLVITDVVLPGLSGSALVRLLRRELPSIPVVLMSGYFDHPSLESIGDEGATLFLQKPFEIDDLVQHVRRSLNTA
jgi:DNA-binding NtrC family response regulator